MSSSFSGDIPTRIDRDKGKSPLATASDYHKLDYYQDCLGESLIDDILATVNNDVGEALPLLEKMFISENQDVNGKGKEFKSIMNHDYEPLDTQGASFVGVPPKFDAEYFSPWVDDDLIEEILASCNNDVDVASSSLEAIFNFEGNNNTIEKVETFDGLSAPFVVEEEEEEYMNFITRVSPSSDEEDYFYPCVDESLIEAILASLNDNVDPPSSPTTEAIMNSEDNDMNVKKVDHNGNEFESFDVLSEYEPSCFRSGVNESLIEDIYSGLNSNVNVDVASSLIEAMLNLEVEDVHPKKVESVEDDFILLDAESASFAGKGDMSYIIGGPSGYEVNYFDPWVVETLIEDILAGGNVDVASSIIESMFNSVDKDVGVEKVDSSVNDFKHKKQSFIVEKKDEKERDIYQLHRRDALKAIRSAREHSQAAKDAQAKGDHASARRFSRLANAEWIMAKKLNAEAAKEILAVKNRKNDLWTLDLHGQHVPEAVEALRQRLETVESLLQKSDSLAALVQSKNLTKKAKAGKRCTAPKQRQICLRAITGRGKHSNGAAKLAPAIKKFLTEKRYHFDASKPGLFSIQPKFCKQ